jgi:Flp pilus assembly protein TadB
MDFRKKIQELRSVGYSVFRQLIRHIVSTVGNRAGATVTSAMAVAVVEIEKPIKQEMKS